MITIKVSEKHKVRLRAWVKALRSGRYKQGSGTLLEVEEDSEGNRKEVGYCCLGVAEVVRGTSKRQILKHSALTIAGSKYYGFGKNYDPTVAIDSYEHETTASEANDDHGWSFKKIARAIERTYALQTKTKKKGKR